MLKRQACVKFQRQIFDESEVIQILKVVRSSIFAKCMFAQTIDCGYTLEPPRRPPRRDGSDEFHHLCIGKKNKKKGIRL